VGLPSPRPTQWAFCAVEQAGLQQVPVTYLATEELHPPLQQAKLGSQSTGVCWPATLPARRTWVHETRGGPGWTKRLICNRRKRRVNLSAYSRRAATRRSREAWVTNASSSSPYGQRAAALWMSSKADSARQPLLNIENRSQRPFHTPPSHPGGQPLNFSAAKLQSNGSKMAEMEGAERYLASLRAENTLIEAEINNIETATKVFLPQATASFIKPATKGVKILSWEPPCCTQAGVDNGSSWRPPQTGERKTDGSMYVAS